MEQLKVSVIVAVYKDIEALELIVEAMKNQTYKHLELVVAEDNNAPEMATFIDSVEGLEVLHTFQEDNGIRKARSMNNAIIKSTGDYLIFIDGDCVPYSNFVEGHLKLAEKGAVLAGRRVNLGPKYSQRIRSGQLSALSVEKSYLWRLPLIIRDCQESHCEAGISLNSDGYLFNRLVKHKSPSIVGCNYSCFREDMFTLNGYDESYGQTSLADDTDLEWRFRAYNLTIKSCKYAANMFHLFHGRSHREIDSSKETAIMMERKQQGQFRCEEGLSTH